MLVEQGLAVKIFLAFRTKLGQRTVGVNVFLQLEHAHVFSILTLWIEVVANVFLLQQVSELNHGLWVNAMLNLEFLVLITLGQDALSWLALFDVELAVLAVDCPAQLAAFLLQRDLVALDAAEYVNDRL